MYIAMMMDRKMGGPAMIVSPHGGMDIETVAKDTPDAIFVVITYLFTSSPHFGPSSFASFLPSSPYQHHFTGANRYQNGTYAGSDTQSCRAHGIQCKQDGGGVFQ